MHVVTAPAVTADQTRRMMVHEDTVSGGVACHSFAGPHDFTHRFVTRNQRRFTRHVPVHRLTGTQATGADAHQQLSRFQRGQADLF